MFVGLAWSGVSSVWQVLALVLGCPGFGCWDRYVGLLRVLSCVIGVGSFIFLFSHAISLMCSVLNIGASWVGVLGWFVRVCIGWFCCGYWRCFLLVQLGVLCSMCQLPCC